MSEQAPDTAASGDQTSATPPTPEEMMQMRYALITNNRKIEEAVLRTLDRFQGNTGIDQRWLAIARTELEKGFMALNRSILPQQRVEGDL